MKSPHKYKWKEPDYDEKSWLLLESDIPHKISNEDFISSCFSYMCDPTCRPYRYLIAILLSFVMGILSYCSDVPGGIQSTMIQVMKLDSTQYSIIFIAYTWPDIVMSLFGTVVVNQFLGICQGFIVFTSIVLLGQVLCSVGSYVNSFWVLLLGRIVLGSGTGTTISILYSFLGLWFEGKEVAFAMSLARCFCRLGATLALNTPQLTYDALDFMVSPYNRLGTTQMVGTVLCTMCVGLAMAVTMLDKHGIKCNGRKPYAKKQIRIIEVVRFPAAFWTVGIFLSLYYAVVISLTANGPLFFANKYGLSMVMAYLANSLSYATVIVVTPFIAMLIDFYGYNLVWGLLGISLAITSNVMFFGGEGSSQFIPFLAATLYSLSFSFFGSAIWVTVNYLVPKHQLTTAYGVFMSMYALTLSIVGVLAGIIIDHLGYLTLGIFYLSILFLVALCNILLSVSELCSEKKVLNISGKQRRDQTKSCNIHGHK